MFKQKMHSTFSTWFNMRSNSDAPGPWIDSQFLGDAPASCLACQHTSGSLTDLPAAFQRDFPPVIATQYDFWPVFVPPVFVPLRW
jgi:hypothetical protein